MRACPRSSAEPATDGGVTSRNSAVRRARLRRRRRRRARHRSVVRQWAVFSPDELADYGQVVDRIVAQPWSNGHVGTWVISYGGGTAELAATTRRTGIRAVAPPISPMTPTPTSCTRADLQPALRVVVVGLQRGPRPWRQRDSGRREGTHLAGAVGTQWHSERPGSRGEGVLPRRLNGAICLRSHEPGKPPPRALRVRMPYLFVTGWLDGADARGALRRTSASPSYSSSLGPGTTGGQRTRTRFERQLPNWIQAEELAPAHLVLRHHAGRRAGARHTRDSLLHARGEPLARDLRLASTRTRYTPSLPRAWRAVTPVCTRPERRLGSVPSALRCDHRLSQPLVS